MSSAYNLHHPTSQVLDTIILDGQAAHDQRVRMSHSAVERDATLNAVVNAINSAIMASVERDTSVTHAAVIGDDILAAALRELYVMLGFVVSVTHARGKVHITLDATEERPIALTLGEIDRFDAAMSALQASVG